MCLNTINKKNYCFWVYDHTLEMRPDILKNGGHFVILVLGVVHLEWLFLPFTFKKFIQIVDENVLKTACNNIKNYFVQFINIPYANELGILCLHIFSLFKFLNKFI